MQVARRRRRRCVGCGCFEIQVQVGARVFRSVVRATVAVSGSFGISQSQDILLTAWVDCKGDPYLETWAHSCGLQEETFHNPGKELGWLCHAHLSIKLLPGKLAGSSIFMLVLPWVRGNRTTRFVAVQQSIFPKQ